MRTLPRKYYPQKSKNGQSTKILTSRKFPAVRYYIGIYLCPSIGRDGLVRCKVELYPRLGNTKGKHVHVYVSCTDYAGPLVM